VAELAGRGHTSPEIANALFLSPRTVESHVASAMRKLGVASRRDLSLVSNTGRPAEERNENKLP
jgi:DNA-binding CsgD family transcriptional regulator